MYEPSFENNYDCPEWEKSLHKCTREEWTPSVLNCFLQGMVWYGVLWYGMVRYSMVQDGMVWYWQQWYGMCGKVWYGSYSMVWQVGKVWYGIGSNSMVCVVRYGIVLVATVWYRICGKVWYDIGSNSIVWQVGKAWHDRGIVCYNMAFSADIQQRHSYLQDVKNSKRVGSSNSGGRQTWTNDSRRR